MLSREELVERELITDEEEDKLSIDDWILVKDFPIKEILEEEKIACSTEIDRMELNNAGVCWTAALEDECPIVSTSCVDFSEVEKWIGMPDAE